MSGRNYVRVTATWGGVPQKVSPGISPGTAVPTGSRSVFISTVAEMLRKIRDSILDQVVQPRGYAD